MCFYYLGLDKVTNLNFTGGLNKNGTAVIHFNQPRGNYDAIRVDCYAQDQHCWKPNNNLSSTINCSICTSISISKVIRGVKYICQAVTIKEHFDNITSDEFIIKNGE